MHWGWGPAPVWSCLPPSRARFLVTALVPTWQPCPPKPYCPHAAFASASSSYCAHTVWRPQVPRVQSIGTGWGTAPCGLTQLHYSGARPHPHQAMPRAPCP